MISTAQNRNFICGGNADPIDDDLASRAAIVAANWWTRSNRQEHWPILGDEAAELLATAGEFAIDADGLLDLIDRRLLPRPATGEGDELEFSASDIVAAGGPSVGLRIPDHPIPRALAAGLGHPIAGTSANRSGMPSARTAAEVRRQLGNSVDCILGGSCGDSLESTILDLTQDPPALLRRGPIPLADLQEALGHSLAGHSA